MPTIDTTYFEADLSLGNITGAPAIAALTQFIAKFEKKYLEGLFGFPLYKAYTAGIAVLAPDQKWLDIRDGKEYTSNGKAVYWTGLKSTVGTLKVSPIANFVYYHYRKDNASFTQSGGEAKAKTKDMIKVSPRQKMIDAWNEMAPVSQQLIAFLEEHATTYPEFDGVVDCELIEFKNSLDL